MAQLPKCGFVRGHDKAIHGSCAIYFTGGTDACIYNIQITTPTVFTTTTLPSLLHNFRMEESTVVWEENMLHLQCVWKISTPTCLSYFWTYSRPPWFPWFLHHSVGRKMGFREKLYTSGDQHLQWDCASADPGIPGWENPPSVGRCLLHYRWWLEEIPSNNQRLDGAKTLVN